MITLFDVVPFLGLIGGGVVGHALGARLGVAPGFGGTLLGAVLGYWFGRLSVRLMLRWWDRDFLKRRTVAQLRRMLWNPNLPDVTAVLLELGSRGEKLDQELPLVLDRLSSPQQEICSRAWRALQVVYPSHAKLVSEFRVEDPPERCKQLTERLKRAEPSGGCSPQV
jgi:hypothetical protein